MKQFKILVFIIGILIFNFRFATAAKTSAAVTKVELTRIIAKCFPNRYNNQGHDSKKVLAASLGIKHEEESVQREEKNVSVELAGTGEVLIPSLKILPSETVLDLKKRIIKVSSMKLKI